MDWNIFWSAFGAIGGTVGALATAGAVIVALWQTRFNQKKKLKLLINENIKILAQNTETVYEYIGITATNIGNRDIIINSWGIMLRDGCRIVILNDVSPIDKLIQINLPHKIAIEESIDLMYSKKHFLDILCKNIGDKKLLENKKLEFYVKDSTGNFYIVKTSKKVKTFL